jgi:hypothetical protein
MKRTFNLRGRIPAPGTTPPPLYRAICDQGGQLGTFTTIEAAHQALGDLLEEYHESIAFESDRHHHALDERFFLYSYVEVIA